MNYRVLMAPLVFLSLLDRAAADRHEPPLVGLWQTQAKGGVIAVVECGGKICARIAGIVLDNPTDPTPMDYHGVSQCGLELVNDATETKPGLWTGHITDPRSGSTYGVEMWLEPDGRLALRGYLGVSLLGRTETWTRYGGSVPPDCRMTPGEAK
jgi:uncharacterized protein (DUF2147 family)